MKIRTGHVSNSSTSSFIIKEDIPLSIIFMDIVENVKAYAYELLKNQTESSIRHRLNHAYTNGLHENCPLGIRSIELELYKIQGITYMWINNYYNPPHNNSYKPIYDELDYGIRAPFPVRYYPIDDQFLIESWESASSINKERIIDFKDLFNE